MPAAKREVPNALAPARDQRGSRSARPLSARSLAGRLARLLCCSPYGFLLLAAETNTGIVVRIISAGIIIVLFVVVRDPHDLEGRVSAARLADALMVGVTLIVVVFASLYLSMSKASAPSFSETLDRTGAM